jgi:hypothetical protein
VIVLFPVTLLRARRALAGGVEGASKSKATGAIAISILLLLASIAYLVMVLPGKLQ